MTEVQRRELISQLMDEYIHLYKVRAKCRKNKNTKHENLSFGMQMGISYTLDLIQNVYK